jgi:uncharacterized protein YlxW (UPF0749 family)
MVGLITKETKRKTKKKFMKINEDWERVSLTDYIYLQEQSYELDQEIRELMNERKPANIIVIDKDKILEHESIKSEILPF